MSHKTELKTTLTDSMYIKKALDKLGFVYVAAENGNTLTCDIMDGTKVDVEIKITGNGNTKFKHNIGFKKEEDSTYTATGDFWNLKTKDNKKLTKELLTKEVTAASKEAELIDRLSVLGFNQSFYEEDSHSIQLKLSRWV